MPTYSRNTGGVATDCIYCQELNTANSSMLLIEKSPFMLLKVDVVYFSILGKMHATLDAVENAAKFHRDLGLKTYMAPILAFTKTNMKYSEYSQYFHTTVSILWQSFRII